MLDYCVLSKHPMGLVVIACSRFVKELPSVRCVVLDRKPRMRPGGRSWCPRQSRPFRFLRQLQSPTRTRCLSSCLCPVPSLFKSCVGLLLALALLIFTLRFLLLRCRRGLFRRIRLKFALAPLGMLALLLIFLLLRFRLFRFT